MALPANAPRRDVARRRRDALLAWLSSLVLAGAVGAWPFAIAPWSTAARVDPIEALRAQ
jgi:hypothetical protein